jgi:hypothetical protein
VFSSRHFLCSPQRRFSPEPSQKWHWAWRFGGAWHSTRRCADARATEILYDEGANQDTLLLSGKTLGLVGCGNLGRALLPLLKPFSRDILVHDPWIQPAVLREMKVEPCALMEVFQRSRVVFILAATTTENQNGLDRRFFEAMPRGSIVVLVSRAGVVHWDDLLNTAASGHIRAAIDVFPDEPIAHDARVRDTPNTILSAHRAGNVPEVWTQMGEMVVDDLEWILRGLPPQRMQRALRASCRGCGRSLSDNYKLDLEINRRHMNTPRLDEEQIAAFRRDGYLKYTEPVLEDAQFVALRDHFETKLQEHEARGERPEADGQAALHRHQIIRLGVVRPSTRFGRAAAGA